MMEDIKVMVDFMSRIEALKDFVYNDNQVKKIEKACEYLQAFIDRHGPIDRLIQLLHIVDKQSYILKDDYTIDEAAQYLGFSKRQIYRMVESHVLPSHKPSGKSIFIKRKEITKWIDSNKFLSQDEMDSLVAKKIKELDERKAQKKHKGK